MDRVLRALAALCLMLAVLAEWATGGFEHRG